MMGLAKPLPQKAGVDGRSWEAFKKRHNMRYNYAQAQKRREGGGDG